MAGLRNTVITLLRLHGHHNIAPPYGITPVTPTDPSAPSWPHDQQLAGALTRNIPTPGLNRTSQHQRRTRKESTHPRLKRCPVTQGMKSAGHHRQIRLSDRAPNHGLNPILIK